MLTLPTECKPVFQQYEVFSLISVLGELRSRSCVMSTFLSVQGVMSTFLSIQGMCHVHFPLSTGHVPCPLSSQYKACAMSTFLSVQGTAMTPQLVMTHVHLPLMMRVESSTMWQCVSGWVVSSMSEDCCAFIFNGWTLKDGASQTQHHIL